MLYLLLIAYETVIIPSAFQGCADRARKNSDVSS
jgi:hypothetical protein